MEIGNGNQEAEQWPLLEGGLHLHRAVAGMWSPSDERWLILPLIVASLSLLLLGREIGKHIVSRRRGRDSGRPGASTKTRPLTIVEQHGGIASFTYMIVRVLGCIALVGLSIPAVLNSEEKEHLRGVPDSRRPSWNPYMALLVTNVYSLALSTAALGVVDWRRLLIRVNNSVLLAELGISALRNVWPLAIYGGVPLDGKEGNILWAKLAALVLTAIVVPLWIPKSYTPQEAKMLAEAPHPEELASKWSSYTYGYLTPVITAANKTTHLSTEALPPMANYDKAQVVAESAVLHLNPHKIRKSRHLAFGLLQTLASDLFWGIVAMSVHASSHFATPLAIRKILTILESEGAPTSGVRPWFWLVVLLGSPIWGSIGLHASARTMSRAFVLIESILTQLVFEHSLQIRTKAGALEDGEGPETSSSTKPRGDTSNFIGKLNNLITVDLANVSGGRDSLLLLWLLPIQIIGCTAFLYVLLGWSAFVGIATMAIMLLTLPGYLTAKIQDIQVEKLKSTDQRTATVVEAMNVLRMIKTFGWERKMQQKIDERREVELGWVWKTKIFYIAISAVTYGIPTFAMLASYATLTLIMKTELTAAIVFPSMILFDTMRNELSRGNIILSNFISAKVSLGRFDAFFRETEFLDRYQDPEGPGGTSLIAPLAQDSQPSEGFIGFNNACFTWNPASPSASSTPSAQFKLTIPGKLEFVRGKINVVVGPTGSGKTSLLMALLGEMHFAPTQPDSFFNLPRGGGVSFAVQESWVQNETVKQNILFTSPYDEKRYRKVLKQCALEKDLDLFEAGDETEVGERGVTLSGGQKARLTLARAIYSNAEIILLDDVLAALDVHTAKWIVNNCFQGDLVPGRTLVLVTHNVALVGPIADRIVSVDPRGVVSSSGRDITDIVSKNQDLEPEEPAHLDSDGQKTTSPTGSKPGAKLIIAEEIQEGNVSWSSIKLLLKAMGGNYPSLYLALWFIGPISQYLLQSLSTWFIGEWSSQYERMPMHDVPNLWYMDVYAGIMFLSLIIFYVRDLWFVTGTMRSSRKIHQMLSQSILGTTLRWLDETPVSRIITRMTQDMQSIDGTLMWFMEGFASQGIQMVIDLFSAVLFVPVFTIPGIIIAVIGIYIGSMYLKAQLSVKRETSNAKAPMVAHFGAAMAGLVSIRAYAAEGMFREEARKRVDHYVRLSRLNYDLNRWVAVRIDTLGALFTASLAAYLTYSRAVSAANVGFSLNRSVEFCAMVLYVVRVYNMLQVEANSIERIVSYLDIDQEEKPTEHGTPPAAWPTSGDVRVEKLTARYSKGGPPVLHSLSFRLPPGSRIGVVGRTGSGKSSLTLALLRLILTEGTVYLDGLPTNEVNLSDLRSKITIIPQLPELLTGTIRYNLDPFDEYDDATLNAALRSSGLYASGSSIEEARLQLDSNIASGGTNVSVGQRQIIALARAMIRSSKLLILDEATSAIDRDTDAIIQNTLRQELGADVTVLTIAHRLQTILDADSIMVLDAGRIVEFASPRELLARQGSLFKSLVDESAERAKMYALVGLAFEPNRE